MLWTTFAYATIYYFIIPKSLQEMPLEFSIQNFVESRDDSRGFSDHPALYTSAKIGNYLSSRVSTEELIEETSGTYIYENSQLSRGKKQTIRVVEPSPIRMEKENYSLQVNLEVLS